MQTSVLYIGLSQLLWHGSAAMAIGGEPHLTALMQSTLIRQFAEQHKHIPRLTYFTCHRNPININEAATASSHNEGIQVEELQQHLQDSYRAKNVELIKLLLYQGKPFIRIVQMDVLRQAATGTKRNNNNKNNNVKGRPKARGSTFSYVDWLDDVLKLEALKQFVVVDLACGPLSRRFLELASAKMYFNDKFHWLLMEDYALHMKANFQQIETSELLLQQTDDLISIESFMEGLNFYINTELTLAKRMPASMGVGYTLYDVWNPGLNYGGHVNLTEIGSFTPTHGLLLQSWFRTTSTVLRRQNMQHARVRCMVVVTNKNMTGTLMYYLTHPVSGHIDTMNRFNFNLLMAVRDMFNWTFVLSRTSSWGYVKNGRYDGMIGALIRNETDIGGAPIFYWLERHKWIDVAGRSWSSRPCFIFRHPRNTQKDRIVFLQPFTNDVWILIVICGVFTVFILWLLTTIEWKLVPHDGAALIKPKGGAPQMHHHRHHRHHPQQEQQQPQSHPVSAVVKPEDDNLSRISVEILPITGTFFQRCLIRLKNHVNLRRSQRGGNGQSPERVGLFLESVLFFVGIICQQGLGFSTSFISGRCIVITSLLFSFSIYQFYSASIVGTLLMEKPKTIKTLSDLVHSSLKVGVEDILYNRDYFLHTKDPVSMELYAKKITSLPPNKDNEGAGGSVGAGAAGGNDEEPESTQAGASESAKSYRDIVHSHETGAHAKDNAASNWLDPDTGLQRVKHERFAFHVDVAAAYRIIAETFNEREICDLTEVSMFPPQKTVNIMQKNSPMRKAIAYGLRRVTETGILKYHFNVWHSRKPPCVKKIETSDLHVDMDTVSSALLILIFSYGITLLILAIEILYSKWQYRIVIELN
ncbi:ionotropic receptor 75a [Drosophila tropicalis]|uniref:ionotropic receptor 75a n=1 Tax=Drosophila tropicalis TaxID=46794 RepID=UPI0035AB8D65